MNVIEEFKPKRMKKGKQPRSGHYVNFLKQRRQERGLKQIEVARMVKVNRSAVWRAENGDRPLPDRWVNILTEKWAIHRWDLIDVKGRLEWIAEQNKLKNQNG